MVVDLHFNMVHVHELRRCLCVEKCPLTTAEPLCKASWRNFFGLIFWYVVYVVVVQGEMGGASKQRLNELAEIVREL